MQQPSSALASQILTTRHIADCLTFLDRNRWQEKYGAHELEIETWANGVWVRQAGLLSYKDLAEYLKFVDEVKGEACIQRGVQQRGPHLWMVKGSQGSYAVQRRGDRFECNCKLWKCRNNRIPTEMPLLAKAWGEIGCHHVVAVEAVMEMSAAA